MLAIEDKKTEMEDENIQEQPDLALSELNEPIWSVVSFEKSLKNNLTYDEAIKLMEESKERKISGLCIITDKAAQRLNS